MLIDSTGAAYVTGTTLSAETTVPVPFPVVDGPDLVVDDGAVGERRPDDPSAVLPEQLDEPGEVGPGEEAERPSRIDALVHQGSTSR